MSNGNSAGLESADASGSGDSGIVGRGQTDWISGSEEEIEAEIRDSIDWLNSKGEWKAAREVEDALVRWKSLCEGERSREALHGEAPGDAKVA